METTFCLFDNFGVCRIDTTVRTTQNFSPPRRHARGAENEKFCLSYLLGGGISGVMGVPPTCPESIACFSASLGSGS